MTMDKERLLLHLQREVYCRLMPSPISGIGVFATRDIPAGIDPFPEDEDKEWIPFKREELEKIHSSVTQTIEDLCVFSEGVYWVPKIGLHTLDIAQFLNHSETPNLVSDKHGEIFVTGRIIKANEELTVDYRIFDEGIEEKLSPHRQ